MISFSSEWVIRTSANENSLESLFDEIGRKEEEMNLERRLREPLRERTPAEPPASPAPPGSAAATSSGSSSGSSHMSCSTGDLVYGTDGINQDLAYVAPWDYFDRNRRLTEINCPELEMRNALNRGFPGAFTRVVPGVYRYHNVARAGSTVEAAMTLLGIQGPDPTLSAWARFNARYGNHMTRFRPEDLVFAMRDLNANNFLVHIAPRDYLRGYGELYPHWIDNGELLDAGFQQRSAGEFVYRGPDGPENISREAQANRVLREMGLEYDPLLDEMVSASSDDEDDDGEAAFSPRELIFARHGNIFFITPALYFRQEGAMYDQALECEELDRLNFRQTEEGVYVYDGDSADPEGLLRSVGVMHSRRLADFLASIGWHRA